MKKDDLINAFEFCTSHGIDISFILLLRDYGLAEMETIHDTIFLHKSELIEIERIIRLYELDINLEGIETIIYLLKRYNEMNNEIITLQNRLRLYEDL